MLLCTSTLKLTVRLDCARAAALLVHRQASKSVLHGRIVTTNCYAATEFVGKFLFKSVHDMT
jgi:hypothetical protein